MTHCESVVKKIMGEPYAGNPQVRFKEEGGNPTFTLHYVDGLNLYRGYFVPRSVDPSGFKDPACCKELYEKMKQAKAEKELAKLALEIAKLEVEQIEMKKEAKKDEIQDLKNDILDLAQTINTGNAQLEGLWNALIANTDQSLVTPIAAEVAVITTALATITHSGPNLENLSRLLVGQTLAIGSLIQNQQSFNQNANTIIDQINTLTVKLSFEKAELNDIIANEKVEENELLEIEKELTKKITKRAEATDRLIESLEL